MKRGIIVAMEEFDDVSGSQYEAGDYYMPDMEIYDSVDQDSDTVVDAIDAVDTHTEIVDIIATEGLGNRPQIAAIALSALEQRLFGKPVVGTRVGTESRTRIATEGKNIFARAWDAIIKFIKRIFKAINDFFGKKKEKEWEDRSKEAKSVESKVNKKDIIDSIKALEENSKEGKDLLYQMTSTHLYGYDPDKKEIVKPLDIIKGSMDMSGIVEVKEYPLKVNEKILKIFTAKDDAEVDTLLEEIKKLRTENMEKLKDKDKALPNMSYIEIDVDKGKMSVVKHPSAIDEVKQNITFDVAKEVAISLVQNVKMVADLSVMLSHIKPTIEDIKKKIKSNEEIANETKQYVNDSLKTNTNVSENKRKEVIKFLTNMTQTEVSNVQTALKIINNVDKLSIASLAAIKKLSKV